MNWYVSYAALVILARPAPSDVSSAVCWMRWEAELRSARSYTVPCADVRVRVVFSGPGATRFHSYAFWDGGDIFRIRAAFPKPGVWTWTTDCSDTTNAGLHMRSGRVRVAPYKGKNQVYRHGFPRVSDNHRYLCFADGTPFLWIGDTAWAGPAHSSSVDWAEYLRDRVAKRFTVIQVGTAQDWAGDRDAQGNLPFFDNDLRKPNPAFWRSYESRIQAANDAGLIVLVVGLMEPHTRYPSMDDACTFARYLVGRLHGNAVMFSPSFDSPYMALGDRVGEVVRDATQVHLITQHPGTPSGQATQIFAEHYFDQPYLSYAGVQSGHNGGNRELCARQAMRWNLHLYRRQPTKPVVNLEAMYDTEGRDHPGAFTGDDARSLGWRSFLSGAAGYTYGTDLYRWRTDASKPEYWRRAMALPSSRQMTALHDFFARVPWWKLVPAPERVHNQPMDWTLQSCFAVAHDGTFAVAYIPAQRDVDLDCSAMHGPLRAAWFDPRSGRFVGTGLTLPQGTVQHFHPPSVGDWVLLIEVASPSSLR